MSRSHATCGQWGTRPLWTAPFGITTNERHFEMQPIIQYLNTIEMRN